MFIFSGHDLDREKGIATFLYELRLAEKTYQFTEAINFPIQNIQWENIPENLLTKILDNLLLILGMSYWKTYCPKNIKTPTIQLSKQQAEFWNTVYTKGLGEFYYKNKIDYRKLVEFPHSEISNEKLIGYLTFQKRALLFFGGGKDSIVSTELLKEHHKPFTLFMVNDATIQKESADRIGVDRIVFERKLDPQIFELNKQQGVYNGHIPISAIWAFIGVFAAILYDYRYLITSNEQSSNYGNVEYLGNEMNHQWSKSYEFEQLLQTYVHSYITSDITYFSLLRPFYEIKITQIFAKYQEFLPYFSSCNRNFRIGNLKLEIGNSKRWCGECAKCLFVYILLAAFLPRVEILKIFGRDLLDDPKLLTTLKKLLGMEKTKPFECVGLPEETKLALFYAHQKGEYDKSVGMDLFKKELLPELNVNELEERLLSKDNQNSLPEAFKDVLST